MCVIFVQPPWPSKAKKGLHLGHLGVGRTSCWVGKTKENLISEASTCIISPKKPSRFSPFFVKQKSKWRFFVLGKRWRCSRKVWAKMAFSSLRKPWISSNVKCAWELGQIPFYWAHGISSRKTDDLRRPKWPESFGVATKHCSSLFAPRCMAPRKIFTMGIVDVVGIFGKP